MKYFMSLTVLTVVITILATLSYGQQFPGKYRRIIGCSKKLDVYKPNANGQWPSKARNIAFKISYINKQLYLTINWIADTTNMNGFKIILKSANMSDICIIYDYTDSVKNYPFGGYFFSVNLSMKSKHKNRNFTGLLFPLPSPNNASQAVAFNTRIPIDCHNYAPYINYTYDGKNLRVTINKTPEKCNFKEFEVMLFKNMTQITRKIFATKENVDKLETTMELNICKGKYDIVVSVHDQYFQDSTRCVCRDLENLCRTCTARVIWGAYLVPAKKCKKKARKCILYAPSSKSSVYISELYLLHFFLGLSILFLLVLAILYWKSNFLARNRGIVFFLDDHEPHTNAVNKLVNYMNTCNLRVYLASTFVQNPDIPNQLVVMTEALKSDFILLVLSNALQKRMEAWDKQQDYIEFFKEVNSNILTKQFLEILMASNKLHMCKFDHVNEFGHWPKPCYSLPTDLTKMTTDLRRRRSCCRSLFESSKSSIISVELHNAIQKAFLYEQSYKNWFEEKYHDPKKL